LKSNPARFLIASGLTLMLLVHASDTLRFAWLDKLESFAYDTRLAVAAPGKPEERIIIVDIDEKSIAALGRWPWSRDQVANLSTLLTDHYRAALVGFDIVFSESDDSAGIKRLRSMAATTGPQRAAFEQALDTLAPKLDFDAQLAAAIKDRPVVLGYYFNSALPPRRDGALPQPLFPRGFFGNRRVEFPQFAGYAANLPVLQASAVTAGHFNMLPDTDGVLRRVPMLAELDGQQYESLSLAMFRQLIGAGTVSPQYPPERWLLSSYAAVEALELNARQGKRILPLDRLGRVTVPFHAVRSQTNVGSGGFTYLSAVDVLQKAVPAAQLQGKIVLVGTSAPGLADLRNTPFSPVLPGVEVHATLLSGMLDGTLKHAPAYMLGFEVVLLIVTGALLGWAVARLSPWRAVALTAGVIAAHIGLNLALYSYANIIAPLASLLLLAAGIFVLNGVYGYFFENRNKRQLASLFGAYVAPEVVEEMALEPGRYSMEGRSAHLTVLFAGVQDFKAISQKLPPKELAQLIKAFLSCTSEQIQKNRGTLDKYIGNTAVAFWGAPMQDMDHANHAVQTALAIQRAVRQLAPELKARGLPAIEAAIALNSGPMTVGDMGSTLRGAYTVLGDAVDTGSQLGALAGTYGVSIIAAEGTKRDVPGMAWRELDRVQLPVTSGKGEAITIFEPIGIKPEESSEAGADIGNQTADNNTVSKASLDELALWQQFLKTYRAQQWDLAELQLVNLQQARPCPLYKLYAARIARLRAHSPGPKWDGVVAAFY
jgi:adenylate cyclase